MSRQYQRRATVLRRSASAALAVLALVASIASVFAFQQRTTALRQRTIALHQRNQAIYNQITGEAIQLSASDPSLAAKLNLTAYRMRTVSDLAPRSVLTLRLLRAENTPLPTAVTTSTASASVSTSIPCIVFSPDGRTLASGGYDGKVHMWNVTDRGHPRALGKPFTVASRIYGGLVSTGGSN